MYCFAVGYDVLSKCIIHLNGVFKGFLMNLDYKIIGAGIAGMKKNKGWAQNKLAEKADISNN